MFYETDELIKIIDRNTHETESGEIALNDDISCILEKYKSTKIPYFTAKMKNNLAEVDGFYFAMPECTYCFKEDYDRNPPAIKHYLIRYVMPDWGLPNEARMIEINISTLKLVGFVDFSNKNAKDFEKNKYFYQENLKKN